MRLRTNAWRPHRDRKRLKPGKTNAICQHAHG
jgi:hypothetical protein